MHCYGCAFLLFSFTVKLSCDVLTPDGIFPSNPVTIHFKGLLCLEHANPLSPLSTQQWVV